MATIKPTLAVASFSSIQPAIDNGILTYPSYILCKDDWTWAFVDKDASIKRIKGYQQDNIIVVDELPTENIQSNVFYFCDGTGYLLINNILVPVFKDLSKNVGSLSYDDLSEIPLVNKRGTIVSPIVLSDLDAGCYSVSGQYKIGGNLTTTYVPSSNVIVLIETDNECKYITRIDGKRILVYTIVLETMETNSDEYATQTWVEARGYTTESYVNQAIEDLYNRIINEALVSITKVSQLENDAGYLTVDNFGEIGDEEISSLFNIYF